MALLGDLELTLGTASVQDESKVPPCKFCSNNYETNIEELPLGIAQDCINCRLLLDAIKTWNETNNLQLYKFFYYPYGGSSKTYDSCIELRTEEAHPRYIHLRLSQDASAKVTVVKPLWLQDSSSIRVLKGDTSSDDSINTLKTWIDTCNCQHQCVESGVSQMPDRLLQITEQTIFLREDLDDTNITYSCLSHCWGVKGLEIQLTKSNRLDFCNGIKWATLPKTFREAVQVCIQLGVEYLWIDALCIVQDDLEDWNRTAATMADVYRYAYLTIAATGSKNSGEGCYRRVSTSAIAKPLRKTPGMVVRERRWPDVPLKVLRHNREFLDYPLLIRAWVYQERRLSRRMVHFTNSQLVWECQRFIQGEDGATLFKKDSTAVCSGGNSASIASDWQTTVEEYSHLQLSFEKDRLPAISAIVQAEMRTRKDDVYMAGMWKNSLLEDLLWYRPSNRFLQKEDLRPERMSPSWSWSSVKGPVAFPGTGSFPRRGDQIEGVQMTEISFIVKGPPHMGEYSEASIKLRAPFTEAIFLFSQSGPNPDMSDLVAKRDSSHPPSKILARGYYADYNFLDIQDQELDSQQYAFVFISTDSHWGWGLALRRRSDTEYERIGICSCYMLDWESDDDTSVEDQPVRSYLSSLPLREVKII